jgi:hypothetical protein
MSSTSLDSYESDSDSYEQDSSHVEGTQYETDSASGRERSEDSYNSHENDEEEDDDEQSKSFAGSDSEDDDGWGTGSSRSRSNYDDEEGSSSFDDGGSQSDEEDDNSEFWNRYGKNDDDTDRHDGRPERPNGKWTGPLSRGSSDDEDDSSNDEFDDEYGLAFPSIAGTPSSSTPAKRKQKKSGGSGSSLGCSPCRFGCLKNRSLMWTAVAGLLIVVVIVVVVLLYKRKDDETSVADKPDPLGTTGSPTPSQSPTLAGLQIQIPMSFFGLLPDGQENEVDIDILEDDLSEAFDLLAQEILDEIMLETISGVNATNQTLTNTTQSNSTLSAPNPTNQSIQEAGNPKVGIRRRLKGVSVQVPSSVEVTEIGELLEKVDYVHGFYFAFSHTYFPVSMPNDPISRRRVYVHSD